MREILQTRRLFVIILTLGLFIMAARSVTDPDVWWHLRSGQLMLRNHAVFHSDPYSFTRFGQPWVDHEWLSQVLIFALYQFAGWGGLITGFAVVIAVAFLLVFLRSPGRPYVAGMVTVWGALASIPCWGVRPQVLTLLLASVFLWILERSYERPSLLWWTPPLLLLWVNLHAGYALGLGLLLLFWVGDVFDKWFGFAEGTDTGTRTRRLALVIAAGVVVIPLNPYGIRMFSYPLQTLHSKAMQAYIGEWLSPDFHQGRYLPALLMIMASLVLSAISPRRLRPRELLLLVVMTYAALRSVRHIPIYALAAAPLVGGMIEARLKQSGKIGWLSGSGLPLTRGKMILNAGLLAGFLIFTSLRLRDVIRDQAQAEAREFPAAAAAFLSAAPPAGPLLNHYNWGGYFIWKLYPEYPVFIDGRADLYGDTFLDGFAASYYLKGKSWRNPVDGWQIRTVVLPPDAPLVVALAAEPGWKTVFADSQAVILTRPK